MLAAALKFPRIVEFSEDISLNDRDVLKRLQLVQVFQFVTVISGALVCFFMSRACSRRAFPPATHPSNSVSIPSISSE